MDPYVRLRVGHYVYETQTDPNGGKTPRWNRVVHCQLPTGVNTMYVEIYDECSFTMDELIAYTEVKIPDGVLRGETHEDWYPLSGKQGDGVEGMIDLVLSFTTVAASPSYLYQSVQPVVMVPNVSGRPMPVFISPAQPQVAPLMQQPPPPPPPMRELNEEELKQIEEMFPNLDKEVIKSIVIANNGNKDTTINSLLQMTNP